MFIIYECAACVIVAMIVAAAVLACAILLLLSAGRGIMERTMHQLTEGVSWLLGAGLVAKPPEP